MVSGYLSVFCRAMRGQHRLRLSHLDDVMVPYSEERAFQADHVLHGRDSIILVETKHWGGKVVVSNGSVSVLSRGRSANYGNPVEQARRNRERVLRSLREFGLPTPVFSVVVFSNPKASLEVDEATLPHGVIVVPGRGLEGVIRELATGRFTHQGSSGEQAWEILRRIMGGFWRQRRLHKMHQSYVRRNERQKTESRGFKRMGLGVGVCASAAILQFSMHPGAGLNVAFSPTGLSAIRAGLEQARMTVSGRASDRPSGLVAQAYATEKPSASAGSLLTSAVASAGPGSASPDAVTPPIISAPAPAPASARKPVRHPGNGACRDRGSAVNDNSGLACKTRTHKSTGKRAVVRLVNGG